MSSRTLSKPPSTTSMSTAVTPTTTTTSAGMMMIAAKQAKQNQKTASSPSSSASSSSIVALPSMSRNLFILPQAKHLDNLPVHPTSSAQRYAESEAKLKKALERNAAREDLPGMIGSPSLGAQGHPSGQQRPYPPRTSIPQPIYSEPSSPISHSPPIMMRSPAAATAEGVSPSACWRGTSSKFHPITSR